MFRRWFILPFRPLLAYGFKHASAVQAISTYLAAWAKRAGYPGNPQVIGNGVDLAHFQDVRAADIGKQPGEVWLVTASRLVRKNAVDDGIRALALLSPNVHFAVFGTGPDEPILKALARSLGVAERVHWFGFISHADLPSCLHACDIFIRPSRSEGMGNSFIEAMVAGLPVIATQEGGIADFLFDTKRNPDKEPTGWAVDRDSPEQIAEAVKDIVANPEKVAQTCANALRLVRETYDWDLIARQMRTVFATLGV